MDKKTILVVEDEVSLINVLVDKFHEEGFEVLTAKNGVECIKIAISQKPDLILLDIVMPEMDGITALEKLRQDAWGKNVPVIILTNLSDSAQVANAIERGSKEYLIKSDWKLAEIVEKVKNELNIE